jgi:type IV pilus assembly protein PilV
VTEGAPHLSPQPAGFSLLEVLVAMTLLALGVLGMGGLQLSVLRSQQDAQFRTEATLLAADLLERAIMNRGESYTLAFSAEPPLAPDCLSQPCTPPQLARFDLARWRALLAEALPEGNGAVQESGFNLEVTVRWRAAPSQAPTYLSLVTQRPPP